MVVVLACLAGCGSTPALPPPKPVALPDARPADFTLAVTVLAPAHDRARPADLPRSLQPGRYIVEPDGSLRVALGPGSTVTTFPPRTRTLSPRQMDMLWRQVRDSGLLDPGNPGRITGPEEALRSRDRTTGLFYIAQEGNRATVRVLLDRSEASLGAERLVDRLAELGWVK